jgi:3-oxoacyl-[acyl-carrier-protein] synthase-3
MMDRILSGKITAIATYLPQAILSNQDIFTLFPDWSPEKIFEKTGINQRHIAREDETSVDMACAAARKLFSRGKVKEHEIDYLIFCTQTPDYILPTSACIIQNRIGLRSDIGAIDINLGCSGFVYGLSLANALIANGDARRVLLLSADTYSKLLHPLDRGVRSLFGDGAAATLIEASISTQQCLGPFVLGTDGSGAPNLIVPAGGFRNPVNCATSIPVEDLSGNLRSQNDLYMNGAAIMTFTLRAVPEAFAKLLQRLNLTMDDFDAFIFHQASALILNRLRQKLNIPDEKFVMALANFGNTVSSTIPMALAPLLDDPRPRRLGLVGFGVGYSWAATQALIGENV